MWRRLVHRAIIIIIREHLYSALSFRRNLQCAWQSSMNTASSQCPLKTKRNCDRSGNVSTCANCSNNVIVPDIIKPPDTNDLPLASHVKGVCTVSQKKTFFLCRTALSAFQLHWRHSSIYLSVCYVFLLHRAALSEWYKLRSLFTCNSTYCCSTSQPSQFCLSIHLSVWHTCGSVQNSASQDHQIFTIGCLEDSSFRNRKAFP